MLRQYLAPTAISKGLHDRVNFLLKDLCEFTAKLIDPGRLTIIEPGIVEHKPDIIHILPRFLILPCIQLPFDGRKVHGILHNVKIILKNKMVSVYWIPQILLSTKAALSSHIIKNRMRQNNYPIIRNEIGLI